MLNQVILIGKLVWVYDQGITLKVERNEKTTEGKFEYDIISVGIETALFNKSKKFLDADKDITIGVKARLISEGDDHSVLKLMADKMTFLPNKTM